MTPIEREEMPHRRKSTGRKRFKVEWRPVDPATDDSAASFLNLWAKRPFVPAQRYETQAAAEQAIENWKKGQGHNAFLYPHPKWKAEIVPS